jgi:histidine triad (HIT) family protein
MAQCVFCRIISGDLPAARLMESDQVLSFMDINPVNPGHALVVPKRHVRSLLDLQEEELHAAMSAVKRVARAVMEATDSPAFNVFQSDGEAAGQVIGHVHFHVIPRHPDDGLPRGWRQLRYTEGEMDALQAAIRSRL